jgi:hypothetical protein
MEKNSNQGLLDQEDEDHISETGSLVDSSENTSKKAEKPNKKVVVSDTEAEVQPEPEVDPEPKRKVKTVKVKKSKQEE